MQNCATCSLFNLESENEGCLHVNRPGGLDLTRAALAACNLSGGSSILDAACGSGATLRYLFEQGFKAVGVDLSVDMLYFDSTSPKIQADCSRIPLSTASQDAVLIECALSLSKETEGALTEFSRLLRPGGWLVITDLYIRELNDIQALDCLSKSSCIAGIKTEEYIRKNIENAGFSIRTWQDQTPVFKQWLGEMVFKLGSLNAFYRQLASCEEGSQALANTLGNGIKLGYYWMAAQKMG
jgi:arsenite methyltransferase